MAFSLTDLGHVREAVARLAARSGMGHERIDDLTVAVNEVAINSLRHGGGGGVLRLWVEDAMVVCEVSDDGGTNDSALAPLIGRIRPRPGQEGGFGMWLVHQLCDLVQIRSCNGGSVVRVQMALAGRRA
jgi:anti-sigma regulatory factor (Ser/Thr protein kinase)